MDNEHVICVIKNLPNYLTYGNKYLIQKKQGKYYEILNDAGQIRRYKSIYFLDITQYRDRILTDLGI